VARGLLQDKVQRLGEILFICMVNPKRKQVIDNQRIIICFKFQQKGILLFFATKIKKEMFFTHVTRVHVCVYMLYLNGVLLVKM